MKFHLVALLFALVLALPAVAQDANLSDEGSTSAAAGEESSCHIPEGSMAVS
jgi:hypothetical protein